uniref:Uncharacterized protein n=2 Tax=Caenorhabditis japonica TaxID=281687 RepID=A0A8R1DVT1_CAEJA
MANEEDLQAPSCGMTIHVEQFGNGVSIQFVKMGCFKRKALTKNLVIAISSHDEHYETELKWVENPLQTVPERSTKKAEFGVKEAPVEMEKGKIGIVMLFYILCILISVIFRIIWLVGIAYEHYKKGYKVVARKAPREAETKTMVNQEMEVDSDWEPNPGQSVERVLHATHIMQKILEYCVEEKRRKLVNRQFNDAVKLAVKKEFKTITIDTFDHFLRINDFTIGKHRKAEIRPRLRAAAQMAANRNVNDGEANSDEDDDDFEMDNALIPILHSEDVEDVRYFIRFLEWLDTTFEPIVERFTIFDSWTFKPCSIPLNWINKLSVFNSMHPDMDYCNCVQCVQMARTCRKYFGPLSFKMAQDALLGKQMSYGTIACTDAMLADIAIEYTNSVDNRHRFDIDRFVHDFGRIRCNELKLAVQSIPPYHDELPKPQPLEVIQMLVKFWEIKTIHFEVVKFMENEYYLSRCAWENTGVFHPAYFVSFKQDTFDEFVHVVPYREVGTIDKDAREEVLPVIDIRVDAMESNTLGSNLSLISQTSRNHIERGVGYEWLHQGRIIFNMFRANRVLFIASGTLDFSGTVGTCNWVKYTIRHIMRATWGPREQPIPETGKTVHWIYYIDDMSNLIEDVWNEHIVDLMSANFPYHKVRLNTSEAFNACDNLTIRNYDNHKRADVERGV